MTKPVPIKDLMSDDFGVREAAKATLIERFDELLPVLAELILEKRLRKKYRQHFLTPLVELLEVVRKAGRSAAISAIAPLLDDADVKVRAEAARTLANLPDDACIPILRKAFADPEPDVREAALADLQYGLAKPTCTPRFRKEVTGDIVRFLAHPDEDESYSAATALLKLDQQRAFEVLLDEPYFSPDYPHLRLLLQHFELDAIRLPEEKVLKLIDRFRNSTGPEDPSYAVALRVLSRTGSARAFDLVHEELVRRFGGEPFDQRDPNYAEACLDFFELTRALEFAVDARTTIYLVKLFRKAEGDAIHDIWHSLRRRGQRVDTNEDHSVTRWADLWQLSHQDCVVEFLDEQKAPLRWAFESAAEARKLYDTLSLVPFRCEVKSGKVKHVLAYPYMIEDVDLLFQATGWSGMAGEEQRMTGPPLKFGDELWRQRD